jgi:hypothetical protein
MKLHKGRVAAAGILCAIAATVAVWSGPLASAASGTLHSSASTPVHVSATHRQ